MLIATHPDETVLELYCMEKLAGPKLEAFEEHLLICADCQDRVTETDSFLLGMKGALSRPMEESLVERWNVLRFFQMPVPVWATAAVAVAGIGGVVVTRNLSTQAAPLAIALTATRGGPMPVAKSAGPLDLDLDARDLAPSGSYRVQLVNGEGTEVWSTSSDAHNGHVHALIQQRLNPGQYYVRIGRSGRHSTRIRSALGKLAQNVRRFSFSTLNLAVSATAITAMTPACTGSLTTRSDASGTLPAMFKLITSKPFFRTSRTACSISPPIKCSRQHQCLRPRQPGHGAHRIRQRLFSHQRNRVHGNMLAANVVPVSF